MNIHFSCHAKRRMRLYDIPESAITNILRTGSFSGGKQEMLNNVPSFNFPIKVVFDVQINSIVVITAYPLKRGRK